MRTLESRMPELKKELINLANDLSAYERYSCDYIDNLSDLNYSVLKRAWRKADKKGNLSLANFVNSILKGSLKKANEIV